MADEQQYELVDKASPDSQEDQLPEKVVDLVGTVEDVPAGTIKNALVTLNVSDQSLMALRTEIDVLLATWDGTKTKYEEFKSKRNSIVRTLRTPVKEKAEAGRAEAIAVQRLWIGAEKRITGFYAEQEARLKTKEEEFEAKIRREAEEKARIERERVEAMFVQLEACEWPGSRLIVAQMTDEQFQQELAKVKAQFEEVTKLRAAEAERKAAEAKAAEELAEKNRQEAVRLAEIARQQEEERQKIEDERRRVQEAAAEELRQIEAQKAAALKEIEDAKARAAEEERQRQAEIARQEQAKRDEEERQRLAAEAERLRALAAPDLEKLREWLSRVRQAVESLPEIKTPEVAERAANIRAWLLKYC